MKIANARPGVGSCLKRAETHRLLSLRETDAISREESGLLSSHLASCCGCRAEALALDPTVLFSGRAQVFEDEVSERDLSTLKNGVLSAIEIERSRRRLSKSRMRPSRTWLLRAASLALFASGLTALFVARLRDGQPEKAPNHAVSEAASLSRLTPPVARLSVPPLEGPVSLGAAQGTRGSAPTVYQFPSSSPDEPTVVFVVDRNADL